MITSCDVVVAGLGIAGSSVARELAHRGARVLGLDLHTPPHTFGSSHGRTRIIREAYFEDPLYVPLVREAFDLWSATEAESGRRLFERTGALTIGSTDGELLRGTASSATAHQIPHDRLTASAVRERFPTLSPPADSSALLEQRAGVLFAEPCVETMLELAALDSAMFRFNDPLLDWRRDGRGVRVRTATGEVVCARLILCTGPWTPSLLAAAGLSAGPGLTVERQAIAFFEAAHQQSRSGLPVVLWEYRPGGLFYMLPDTGYGIKAGIHHEGQPFDPASAGREFNPIDLDRITALFDRLLPGVRGAVNETSMCLYTNTPDSRFVIDAHPQDPGVVVVSACSGHGFKFAPAVARIAADLALGLPTGPEAQPFRWSERRPGPGSPDPGPGPSAID